jgi:adenylate cyclase
MVPGDAIIRRLAAILCADVQGYSRMMGVDEQGTLRALKGSHALMSQCIGDFHGRVVNAPGDSLLAEFGSVVDSVSCAVAIQQRLEQANAGLPPAGRMAFRIGINLGDVMVDGEAIYGDGVNVAARLETLAEGGGICISGSAYEQVVGKLDVGFEDLGEKAVKNIARPVRAWRVLREAKPHSAAAAAPAEGKSIAVLPFQNMSGEVSEEYFSDGIAEDIITDLSKLSGLLVIARNSSFAYKGRAVDVRQVGAELGVAHVLEGSVRRAGKRVRVTAQLLECRNGHHLWAERYDRELEDVFALQDEITREIVAALDVRLVRGEQAAEWRRLLRRPEALDAYYRGLDHFNRVTREANAQAAQCFAEVTRLEPGSPLGYLGSAWTELSASRYGWSAAPRESLEQAARLARRALELDERCADAHALLGFYHLLAREHEAAIAAGERSIALAPSHADNTANLACSYLMSGRPEDAVQTIRRAMRLSPLHPNWYYRIRGFAHYQLEQYDEAEEILRLGIAQEPGTPNCRLILAAAHLARGRAEEARHEAQEVLRHDPAFRLSSLDPQLACVKDRALAARFIAELRSLGLK